MLAHPGLNEYSGNLFCDRVCIKDYGVMKLVGYNASSDTITHDPNWIKLRDEMLKLMSMPLTPGRVDMSDAAHELEQAIPDCRAARALIAREIDRDTAMRGRDFALSHNDVLKVARSS